MNSSENIQNNKNRLSIKKLLITFSPILILALVLFWYQCEFWLSLAFIGFITLTFVFIFMDQKRINGLRKNKTVEIDEEVFMEIHNRDIEEQIYLITKLNKLIKKNEYAETQDFLRDKGLQMSRVPTQQSQSNVQSQINSK